MSTHGIFCHSRWRMTTIAMTCHTLATPIAKGLLYIIYNYIYIYTTNVNKQDGMVLAYTYKRLTYVHKYLHRLKQDTELGYMEVV